MIQCPWSFTCHASDPQAPSLAARQSHGASTLGTHKLNLWMKFPKSILIAVTLGDLGDSELMMTCGKHSFKLPGRAFTLKVSLPFRSHWVFMSFLPVVQVKLKWGQCIPLYLDDLLKCLWQWAVGLTAPELHHTLYKGKVSEAAVSFHRGLSVGLGLAVHSHLGGASGFLYLQGFSNQQCVTPGSECSCWLSDSGVPVWPCSSAVKRKPDKFSEAFFFFKETFRNTHSHSSVIRWAASAGLGPRLLAQGLSCQKLVLEEPALSKYKKLKKKESLRDLYKMLQEKDLRKDVRKTNKNKVK